MWRKILIGTGGVLALLVIAAVLLLEHLPGEACGNQVYGEIVSPGKKHKAIIFQRNCGATTGFSTHVSILETDESLGNDSGNIYIVDRSPEGIELEVKWGGDQNLTIRSDHDGSELKAEKKWGTRYSVEITHIARDS